MASVGSKILASEYNSVQTTIATVMGTYYGQTVNSSQVTARTSRITAAQWQALYTDILTAYNHQNSSNGSLTYPTTSNKVQAADFAAYQTMANSCLSNYTNFLSGYSASSSLNSISIPGGWGVNNAGQSTARHFLSVTFTNTTVAQYFFNTGGQIRFTASLASSGSAKDNSWSSMLSHMGTIAFGVNNTTTLAGATTPGTGSSIGYNQLTGSFQLIYSKGTENSTYTPNQYDIYASISGSTINFRIEFEDLSISANQTNYGPGYGVYGVDESVVGATTSTQTLYYASGSGQVSASSYLPTATANTYDFSSSNP